jgi:hypothetical protein
MISQRAIDAFHCAGLAVAASICQAVAPEHSATWYIAGVTGWVCLISLLAILWQGLRAMGGLDD